MAVAPFVKFNLFIEELSKAGHNLTTCVYKAALTNTAPNAATDTTWNTTSHPAPVAAAGYTAGGNTLTTTSALTTTGTFKLILVDTVFTASGGSIGPFRYVILYNSTAANKVVGYYDNGASITLADTDTFTTDFDATNGVFTIA